MRPRILPPVTVVILAAMIAGCTRPSESTARTEPILAASPPIAVPSPPDAGACVGLSATACVQTRGCLLDQISSREARCREAENACERAARHADLIGPPADASVTAKQVEAAKAACTATPGCALTSGDCSCPCAIFAHCDCECGGAYLARCTTKTDRSRFEGAIGVALSEGPLADISRALDEIRRAPRAKETRLRTLPDPKAAIGRDLHEIEWALGKGNSCEAPLHVPCTQIGQVYYSLYHLPANARGGGDELVLTFDGTRCVGAEIRGSR